MKARQLRRKAPRHRRVAVQLGAACCGLLLLAAAFTWLTNATNRPLSIGGPFALTDGHGHEVTDRDFRGRYLLLTFGYTHCRDVCPMTLAAITGALNRLGPAGDRVQPLFVTLDPGRDTPAVVQTYVSAFSPRLIGLTGSVDAVQRMAGAYRVVSIAHPTPSGATMDHSSVIYLIGPDGRYLAPLPADDPEDRLAQRLSRYLS
jgi:protein SCO1/2